MASEFITLTTGKSQERDSARFRVGSCVLQVTVDGASGTFNATDFSAAYSLLGLPTATLSLPIGQPVGVNAAGSTSNTTESLRQAFKKYAKVTVKMTVPELTATADVGSAFKVGEHTIFEGFVSSTRITADAQNSVSFSVSLTHKLVSLASGVALFSSVVYSSGFYDVSTLPFANFASEASSADNPQPVLVSSLDPKPWTTFSNLAKRLIPNATARRSANSLKAWALKDPNISRIVSSFDTSLQLLDEVKPIAELRFTGDSSLEIQRRIGLWMLQLLTDTIASSNLLANAIRVASSLYCGFTFTRQNGYFFPFDEFWPSSRMKTVRGGMAVMQELNIATGREGYDVTGTIVVASIPAGFSTNPTELQNPYSSWVMPESGGGHTLIDVEVYPSWLAGLGPDALRDVVTKPSGASQVAVANVGPRTHTDAPKVEEAPPRNAEGTETTKETTEHFAFYRTLFKNLAANSFRFITPLRDDIVPGINLAVDTIAADGSSATVYGLVSDVNINISAARGTAMTDVYLRFARDQYLQENIIDVERAKRPHFAWLDAHETMNKLRLWE